MRLIATRSTALRNTGHKTVAIPSPSTGTTEPTQPVGRCTAWLTRGKPTKPGNGYATDPVPTLAEKLANRAIRAFYRLL